MIAAGIEGNLLVLVVMAVIGIINWLTSRKSEDQQPPSKPSQPSAGSTRRPPANSEEERMRRFLEALGVPTDSGQRPVPPIVAQQPQRKRREQNQQQQPRKEKKRKPAPPPLPEERSLDELPAPREAAGRISLPELVVPAVPEFRELQVPAGAMPPQAGAEAPVERRRSVVVEEIREDLRSAAALRSAFVLREILGPPKALQG